MLLDLCDLSIAGAQQGTSQHLILAPTKQTEIADTADAIIDHLIFSIALSRNALAFTACERSATVRDTPQIATSASSQLSSLHRSYKLPAVAMLP
jgi:hypothetical protein